MEKQFSVWIQRKELLHHKEHKPPYVSVGDIWWVSLGENIRSEMNGKSQLFSRPAIVLKKLAHGFYLVIPTSTKEKQGSWYVPFVQKGVKNIACLH